MKNTKRFLALILALILAASGIISGIPGGGIVRAEESTGKKKTASLSQDMSWDVGSEIVGDVTVNELGEDIQWAVGEDDSSSSAVTEEEEDAVDEEEAEDGDEETLTDTVFGEYDPASAAEREFEWSTSSGSEKYEWSESSDDKKGAFSEKEDATDNFVDDKIISITSDDLYEEEAVCERNTDENLSGIEARDLHFYVSFEEAVGKGTKNNWKHDITVLYMRTKSDGQFFQIYRDETKSAELGYSWFEFNWTNNSTDTLIQLSCDKESNRTSDYTDELTLEDGKKYVLTNCWQNNENDHQGLKSVTYVPPVDHSIATDVTSPNPANGTLNIYFDATLSVFRESKKSNNKAENDSAIPKPASGSKVYAWLIRRDSNNGNLSDHGEQMTQVLDSSNNPTNFWSLSVNTDNYAYVVFQNVLSGGTDAAGRTVVLALPSTNNMCFLCDAGDPYIHDGKNRGGYWAAYNEGAVKRNADLRSAANASNKYTPAGDNPNGVVDIPTGGTKVAGKNYVKMTLYDYYTDYEINGQNRDNYGATQTFVSYQNWYTFRQFDRALSEYYSSITGGVTNPIYTGNFQPNMENWGKEYRWIAHHQDSNIYDDNWFRLYGYNSSGTAGSDHTGDSGEAAFMAVNNANVTSKNKVQENSNVEYSVGQGIVYKELEGTGDQKELRLNTTNHADFLPYFNKTWLEGTNALHTQVGKVYENVEFPFTKEKNKNGTGVDYWEFNSDTTTVRLKYLTGSADKKVLNIESGLQAWSANQSFLGGASSGYGFFPFNSDAVDCTEDFNYGFGARLDIPFTLPEGGEVQGTSGKVPVTFTFSGDDDVWIFIDGKLVLDLGGAHAKSGGNINFKTKTATADHVKSISGHEVSGTEGGPVETTFAQAGLSNFDYGAQHTLTMFYMERGMWDSNMFISYNFPEENVFELEKQVDVSDVKSLDASDDEAINAHFRNILQNATYSTFEIKTLATHYAPTPTAGTTADNVVYNDTFTSNKVTPAVSQNTMEYVASKADGSSTPVTKTGVAHWKAQMDDIPSEYRHLRYGRISPSSGETVDITANAQYLTFDICVENKVPNLSKMYLWIEDENQKKIGATATTNNKHLSGKVVGIPDLQQNKWITLKVDLNELGKEENFDPTKVKYIYFGYDEEADIYLDNFTFIEPDVQSGKVGFVTKQKYIPDYGSIAAKTLKVVDGAYYTSNVRKDSNGKAVSFRVGSDGQVVLKDDEVINFSDQFRRGSYIAVKENPANVATYSKLFNTSWALAEFDEGANAYAAATYSSGSAGTTDVHMQVDDGRLEQYLSGNDSEGDERSNAGYTSATRPSGRMIVFRNYDSGAMTDNTTPVRIKATYTNTVKVGQITIKKEQATGSDTLNGTYTFKISFRNTGGIGIQDEIIEKTFTLGINDTKTFTGIPVGTEFTVTETARSDSSVLISSSLKDSATQEVSGAVASDLSVSGTIGEVGSNKNTQTATFSNTLVPIAKVKFTKTWKDAGGNEIKQTTDGLPTLNCIIQRRTVSLSDYDAQNNYTGAATWTYLETITVSPVLVYDSNGTHYEWKWQDLRRDARNSSNTSEYYEYRVCEVVTGETTPLNEKTDKVVYWPYALESETYTGRADSSTTQNNDYSTVTVNQAKKLTLDLTVKKDWMVHTDATTTSKVPSKLGSIGSYTANTNLPSSIYFKIYRTVAESPSFTSTSGTTKSVVLTNWNEVTIGSQSLFTLTNGSASFEYEDGKKFEGLDRFDASHNPYTYRVVEVAADGTAFTSAQDVAMSSGYFPNLKDEAATGVDPTDLTQTLENVDTPVSVQIQKIWNNMDGVGVAAQPPVNVLLMNGVYAVESGVLDGTVDTGGTIFENPAWTGTWSGLPRHSATDGSLITYTVYEYNEASGTITQFANNGKVNIGSDGRTFDVTYSNPTSSATEETISASVTNSWDRIQLNFHKEFLGLDGTVFTHTGTTPPTTYFKLQYKDSDSSVSNWTDAATFTFDDATDYSGGYTQYVNKRLTNGNLISWRVLELRGSTPGNPIDNNSYVLLNNKLYQVQESYTVSSATRTNTGTPATGDTSLSLYIANQVQPPSLKMNKKDEAGNLITTANAVFTLTQTSPSPGNNYTAPTATTSSGVATFSNLGQGNNSTTYTLTETSAPTGYTPVSESLATITVDNYGTLTVSNLVSGVSTLGSSVNATVTVNGSVTKTDAYVEVNVTNPHEMTVNATKVFYADGGTVTVTPPANSSVFLQLFRQYGSTPTEDTDFAAENHIVELDGTTDQNPSGSSYESSGWNATWTGLQKYQSVGVPYKYYVKEVGNDQGAALTNDTITLGSGTSAVTYAVTYNSSDSSTGAVGSSGAATMGVSGNATTHSGTTYVINTEKPTKVRVTIEKQYKYSDGTTALAGTLVQPVNVLLYRRPESSTFSGTGYYTDTNGTVTWESSPTVNSKIELNASNTPAWTATIDNLDAYAQIHDSKIKWVYELYEYPSTAGSSVPSDASTATGPLTNTSTDITINGVPFKVTGGIVQTAEPAVGTTDTVYNGTVTNTLDAKVNAQLTKVWSPITAQANSIVVQLEQSTGSWTNDAGTVIGTYTITKPADASSNPTVSSSGTNPPTATPSKDASGNWVITIANLEKYNTSSVPYIYRFVEMNSSARAADGSVIDGYKVTYTGKNASLSYGEAVDSNNDGTMTQTITNEPANVKIDIFKVVEGSYVYNDGTKPGTPLKDAEFKLQKIDKANGNNVIGEWTLKTGNDGKDTSDSATPSSGYAALTEGLGEGDYKLFETVAPVGYAMHSGVVEFSVTVGEVRVTSSTASGLYNGNLTAYAGYSVPNYTDGTIKTFHFVFENTAGTELPGTGTVFGLSRMGFAGLGTVLLTAFIVLYQYKKRRQYNGEWKED